MLSPITKEKSIETQLEELRVILLDNQDLLDTHIHNLTSTSKQVQTEKSKHQNVYKQLEIIEDQLEQLLDSVNEKKSNEEKQNSDFDSKILSTMTPELRNLISNGNNLANLLQGEARAKLTKSIEKVAESF